VTATAAGATTADWLMA